jgi:hypothetical protein
MKKESIEFYKNNCDEELKSTPISVLRYISTLETYIEENQISELKEQRDEMLQMLEEVHYTLENEGFTETRNNMQQLIKKVKNE